MKKKTQRIGLQDFKGPFHYVVHDNLNETYFLKCIIVLERVRLEKSWSHVLQRNNFKRKSPPKLQLPENCISFCIRQL